MAHIKEGGVEMKIYDKKKFWGTIIFFGGFTLLEIFITYIKLGIVRYEPSLFIIICAFTYMMESVSEEKTKINQEREQLKKEVWARHYGKKGKILSKLTTIAAVISLFVLLINFGAGLVMFVITLIINSIVFKSVNNELRQINYDTNQKKHALARNN